MKINHFPKDVYILTNSNLLSYDKQFGLILFNWLIDLISNLC